MIMKALIVMLHTIQKDREHCIRIHQMYRKGVENEIADGVPPRKAERISIAHLIVALSEMVEEEEDLSVINFTKSIVNVLREGGRWQELIDAVAAPEILLIDPDHCQKICEKDGDGHESEILSVRSLEKDFHKDYKLIDVAKITKLGGDDVFAKMKELLLMPDLKLKETCQCLSGLLQLLNRLGEVDESFEREDIEDITISEAARPKEGEDSELVFSLGMEIHQRVMEVLWKYDSGAESGIDDLLCKVASLVMAEGERQTKAESEIEGKETSSNDDGTEEIGSNAGGQDRDFDEDFCIQFLNSDAFSSI
jgi:hypothetical protein